MKVARGFCDLNIAATDTDVRQTVLKALSLGYQTVALNTHVTDSCTEGQGKKRKKGNFLSIPPPPKLTLTPNDLRQHGITREPIILSRITFTYSDPGSPFLSKFRDAIKQYDLVAVTPITDSALKQTTTQTLVDVDIIALGPEERGTRFARKLLRLAVEKGIYFELSYGPCITDSSRRQQTITLSHILHHCSRSANIIITSQARLPRHLRQPYDVINLGRFFGLTEAGAKAAVASMAHNVVYCASMRRRGKAVCVSQVSLLTGADDDESKRKGKRSYPDFQYKFEGLDNAKKYLKN